MAVQGPGELSKIAPSGWNGFEPVAGYEDRFVLNPFTRGDAGRARRAQEMLAAMDEYHAAERAALEESSYDAAELASDAILEKQSDLFYAMLELRPSTLEGLRALATAIVTCCWSGEIRDSSSTDEERGLAVLLSTLTGIAITPTDDNLDRIQA